MYLYLLWFSFVKIAHPNSCFDCDGCCFKKSYSEEFDIWQNDYFNGEKTGTYNHRATIYINNPTFTFGEFNQDRNYLKFRWEQKMVYVDKTTSNVTCERIRNDSLRTVFFGQDRCVSFRNFEILKSKNYKDHVIYRKKGETIDGNVTIYYEFGVKCDFLYYTQILQSNRSMTYKWYWPQNLTILENIDMSELLLYYKQC